MGTDVPITEFTRLTPAYQVGKEHYKTITNF